ncbi:MAG: hypothetical protein K2L75_03095 [Muribaculaceae bacterium]|nr:hypothetical protein [Muribaculaceae bacterium]
MKNIIRQTPLSRTEYRYDDLGRPVAVKRYGASGSSYRYDAAGLVSEIHNTRSGAQKSEYIIYDAEGRRTKRWQTIKNPRLNTISNRYYFGPFTLNADTLERVDFPGGYFDGSGKLAIAACTARR